MNDTFDVKAILSLIDQNFTAGLDAASAKAKSFADGAKISMEDVGKGMMVAGAATTALGVKSLKSFGDFQASLNQAAVVAGGTAKDIGQLDDLANKMGADLPLSAQDCADAMIEMARNGASIKDIKEQFPAISQAATAAGADIKATAGVVQESMNIWGSSLESPQQAAAILVQTANASNASIEDMQQALATIGGTATNAHMSMQTIAESIGLLTNKGFSAAQASMDLNHAILQMQAPSKVARNAMQDLGISFTDSAGKMKQFPDILRELNQALDGLNPDEKAQKLKAMFGTAGMQAIVPLLETVKNKTNDSKVSWDAYAKEQEKAAGSTKKATATLKDQANEMQKNVGSSIEQLGGNWESLRNKSMKSAQDINGATIKNANAMLQWATDSNSSTAQYIRGFIGLMPAIGGATTAVGGFLTNARRIAGVVGSGVNGVSNFIKVGTGIVQVASGAKTAEEAFGTLAKSSRLAAVTQKAFAAASFIASHALTFGIVGAITVVVTALVLFFTKTKTGQRLWSNFINWLKNAWNTLAQTAQAVWNSIVKFFNDASKNVRNAWNSTTSFFSGLWNGIVNTTKSVWQNLVSFFTTLWNGIVNTTKTVWQAVVSFFTTIVNAIRTIWNGLVTFISHAWNSFVTSLQPVISAIKNLFSALKDFFNAIFTLIGSIAKGGWNIIVVVAKTVYNLTLAVWRPIIAFFRSLWNGIATATRTIWNVIVVIARTVYNLTLAVWRPILAFFRGLWNGIVAVTRTSWNIIAVVARTIYKMILAVWRPITAFFKGLWNGIVTVARTAWNMIILVVKTSFNNIKITIQTILNVIKVIFTTGWNILRTVVTAVWNAIVAVVSTAINAVAGVIRAITAVIRGNWSGAWNAIKGVASTVWNGIRSVVQIGINAVRNIVNTVMNAVKSVFSSIWNAIKGVFRNNVNFIKSVMHIDLGAQGRAIMNSLLKGLKDAWHHVTGFVGGIGKWIKEHKGPLSYDEQLLIPAGLAIMNGLGNGLNNGFDSVQDQILNVAGIIAGHVTNVIDNAKDSIQNATFKLPGVDSTEFSNSINRLNGNLRSGYQSQLNISGDNLLTETNNLLRKIVDKDSTIVLDDGTIVGRNVDKVNDNLGQQVSYKDRWS